jgi:hypothetical protein
LKPGLYKNEDLAECSVWARYIFPGLWTMADREGRLEDRPKRIKGELLPYDSIEVEPLLVELQQHHFIARYEQGGMRILQVLKFSKHQNPHKREQASKLPAMPGFVPDALASEDGQGPAQPEAPGRISEHEAAGMFGAGADSGATKTSDMPDASTGHASGQGGLSGGVSPADSLYSDSRISDSIVGRSESSRGGMPPKSDYPPGFNRFWAAWPKHHRKGEKSECLKLWQKHGCEDLADAIIGHVERMKVCRDWTKDAGEYIPAPLVYVRNRRWEGAEDGEALAAGRGNREVCL